MKKILIGVIILVVVILTIVIITENDGTKVFNNSVYEDCNTSYLELFKGFNGLVVKEYPINRKSSFVNVGGELADKYYIIEYLVVGNEVLFESIVLRDNLAIDVNYYKVMYNLCEKLEKE